MKLSTWMYWSQTYLNFDRIFLITARVLLLELLLANGVPFVDQTRHILLLLRCKAMLSRLQSQVRTDSHTLSKLKSTHRWAGKRVSCTRLLTRFHYREYYPRLRCGGTRKSLSDIIPRYDDKGHSIQGVLDCIFTFVNFSWSSFKILRGKTKYVPLCSNMWILSNGRNFR